MIEVDAGAAALGQPGAALAGAGIARANYFKTSLSAFKLAISGFIIPFLIIYNPVLVLRQTDWVWAAGSLIAIPLGMTALTAALYGCGLTLFTRGERALALVSTVMMFGYASFRHVDELPFEYPMLALGCASFAWLVVLQVRAQRTEAASDLRTSAPAMGS